MLASPKPASSAQAFSTWSCAPTFTSTTTAAPERTRQLPPGDKGQESQRGRRLCPLLHRHRPNWFLAKVASDMEKPNGLVMIDDADIPGKLLHLKLTDFCGIGEAMAKRLSAAGITTVAQLYDTSAEQFRTIWGSVAGARFPTPG
jgi:hypothetical protein